MADVKTKSFPTHITQTCDSDVNSHLKLRRRQSLLKNTTSFCESSNNYVKRKGTGRRLSFSDEIGQSLTEVSYIESDPFV